MVDETNDYIAYELLGFVDIQHGQFMAKNTDVHFEEFNSIFNKFITERSLRPKLEV